MFMTWLYILLFFISVVRYHLLLHKSFEPFAVQVVVVCDIHTLIQFYPVRLFMCRECEPYNISIFWGFDVVTEMRTITPQV